MATHSRLPAPDDSSRAVPPADALTAPTALVDAPTAQTPTPAVDGGTPSSGERRRGAHRAKGDRPATAGPSVAPGAAPRGAHRRGAHRSDGDRSTPDRRLAPAAATGTPAATTPDARRSGLGRPTVAAATVAVTALTLGIGGSVATTSVGHAAPPPSITSVQKKVGSLNDRLDRTVEKYDKAKVDLAAATRAADTAQRRVAVARQQLAKARADLALVAAAAYRGTSGAAGMLDSFVAATNPQQFVDQTTTLDELGRSRVAILRNVTKAEHDLADAQRAAAAQLATAKRLAAAIAQHKTEIQRSLREQRDLLGKLKAKQRARLAARQRAAAAQQAAIGSAAVASGHYAGNASGSAAVAVQWAYRELGKPYVWGASGPSAFDCSGLTMYVWGQAGVSLPHSAAAQYGSGTPVSRSQLQPGDLVFFGSPIYHVGIYVGGGNMIEAPHTGDVVKVMPLAYEPNYAGAVRP